MRLTRRSLVAASMAAPLIARPLHAQGAWPQRQIRWVVPFPPAGTADILSRLLAERVAARLGQPVVVDNRAGAGGTIAGALVAQARGDSHIVMVSNFAPHGVSPSLFANIGYDAERDFTHMALFGALPMVIAVNPNLPAQNIQEFIALARQRGAALNMAYGGNGTASHLIGLIFHRAAGISPTFVPYRGAGPALVDVLAGTVECIIETLPAALGHIRAGRLRALAVSSATRSIVLPDVPTFTEIGLAEATGVNWFGFCGPAGLPEPIVARWLQELREVLNMPEVRDRLVELGVEGTSLDPAATAAFVGREVARWRQVVRENNVTAS